MKKIVGLFMMVLVVVVGFFVVRSISDGVSGVPGISTSMECRFLDGTCVAQGECQGEVLSGVDCGEGAVCCRVDEPG